MFILDSHEEVRRVDKSDVFGILEKFPEQCRQALDIGEKADAPDIKDGIKGIVVCGMGGSAVGGDLLKVYLRDCNIPVFVSRNYTVPEFVDKNYLGITASYSGNTEETLGSYDDLKKKGAKIVAITSGGKLKDKCVADGNQVITVPTGYPPRTALGFLFIPALKILEKLGIAGNQKEPLDEMINVVQKLTDEIRLSSPKERNFVKIIAEVLPGRLPVVYGSADNTEIIAGRWRTQFNEFSKVLCLTNAFPEMNHNEIVGWELLDSVAKNSVVIFLKDEEDHARVMKRMEITKSIIAKRCAGSIDVKSRGQGRLARLISLIVIGDFISVYLAVLNGIDPKPVNSIDLLKKELEKI